MIYGKKEVIDLLTLYLERAKNGDFGHAGVVMTGTVVGQPYGVCACDFAGELGLELCTAEGLKLLLKRVEEASSKWIFPAQDPSLNKSYIRYNLANGPMGFDFVTWIVSHEMYRLQAGAPGPLKVAFWKGTDAEVRMKEANREMWLEKVFKPIVKFMGAVEDDTALAGHNSPTYVPRDLVDYAKEGKQIPLLKPTKSGKPGVVTITLREKAGDGNRNSNYEEWIKFASYLAVNCGENIIIVRDTELADKPIDGFDICPEASRDLEVRFGLYADAKMNFFVENGPAALCIFSEAPYVQFNDLNGTERLRRPEFLHWAYHMKEGENYPWSKPNQMLAWKTDTLENMIEAWKKFTEQK